MNYYLMFLEDKIDLRKGGPAGYLANLSEGLKKLDKKNEFVFVTISNLHLTKSNKKNRINKLCKKTTNKMAYLFFPKKSFNSKLKKLQKFNHSELNELIDTFYEESTVIHCHAWNDLLKIKSIKKNSSTSILTSHSPEAPHTEISSNINIISPFMKSKTKKNFYKKLENIVERAFSLADILVFPCKESLEPYFNTWNNFSKIIRNKPLYFVPTGCQALSAKVSSKIVRNTYDIPSKAKVVSFIGRHNKIKGYDLLQEAATKIFKKRTDVYFLIAGTQKPIKGLKDKRWIEIGWTNDPGSIINASDIFVLPNRQTYFDLILLEAMSLGKPIIASKTGGNKYVASLSEGILLFDKDESRKLSDLILDICSLQDYHLFKLGEKNKECYNKHFTSEQFAKRYIKLKYKINQDLNI